MKSVYIIDNYISTDKEEKEGTNFSFLIIENNCWYFPFCFSGNVNSPHLYFSNLRIWVYLQVLKIWDFESTLKSRQVKLAKPSQASSMGSPPGCPQSTWLREVVESLYFLNRPEWTHSQQHYRCHSSSGISKQAITGKPSSKLHNNISYVCKELILSFILQVKSKQ
jgi:hypothetical protein